MKKEYSQAAGKRVVPVIQHGSLTHPESSEVITKHTAVKGVQNDSWEQTHAERGPKSPHEINNVHSIQQPPKALNNEKNQNNYTTQIAQKNTDSLDSPFVEKQRYRTDNTDTGGDADIS